MCVCVCVCVCVCNQRRILFVLCVTSVLELLKGFLYLIDMSGHVAANT